MFISILLGHLDMKSNFIILGGGGTLEVHSHLLQLFQSWGGTSEVHPNLLQLFQSWGGVHLEVDLKSVRFMDSGWLSTAVLTSGQLC